MRPSDHGTSNVRISAAVHFRVGSRSGDHKPWPRSCARTLGRVAPVIPARAWLKSAIVCRSTTGRETRDMSGLGFRGHSRHANVRAFVCPCHDLAFKVDDVSSIGGLTSAATRMELERKRRLLFKDGDSADSKGCVVSFAIIPPETQRNATQRSVRCTRLLHDG